MAVQMYKPSHISRAQRLFNQNVELENKRRKSAHAGVPSDPNIWQQMRENYEAIILEDHCFAEQHEIELALWLLHHKKIEELRVLYNAANTSKVSSATQNRNGGPACLDRLAEIRYQFKTFLSEATGFYHDLMLKIRVKYGLPLDYFPDASETQVNLSKDEGFADMKKGLISCHRCLIYLGDLARYKDLYGDGDSRNQGFAAASSYYTQASSLWPYGGNPHHQLAIVAASYLGDDFLATYRYFRSLAVESPPATARDNLIIAFDRNRENYAQLLADCKTLTIKAASARICGKEKGRGEARALMKENRSQSHSIKEKARSIPETLKAFRIKFVRANGILFTRTSVETFADVLSVAKNDFLVLLSSGLEEQYNFGSDAGECGLLIVRLVAILIFTVHNANRESENQSYAETLQRSALLQNACAATFEFMAHVVQRCLHLHDPLSSYLLPGILVFVEWLACHPNIATCNETGETQANARLFFWNSCIEFFNKLLLCKVLANEEDETCVFNMSKYEEGDTANRLALWEDFELRGFLPLLPAQQILDFSRKHTFGNGNDYGVQEKTTRIQRIIAAGKAFSNVVPVGKQGICFDFKLKKFVFGTKPLVCLDSSPGTLMEDVVGQERLDEKKTSSSVQDPVKVAELEDEDEDEVIVFKPSDKQLGSGFSALTSHEDHGLVTDSVGEDFGVYDRHISVSQNKNLLNGASHEILQASLDTLLSPSIPSSYSVSQYVQPMQLTSTGRLSEPQASVMNDFKNLTLMDSGHSMNQKPVEHHVSLKSDAHSLPFPRTVNLTTSNGYSIQDSEVIMSSKANHIISSGTDLNISSFNSQSSLPVVSHKNPVSRPIRHIGPPPGFSPGTAKYIYNPPHKPSLKDENPIMDDYSWLDGYKMPSSNKQNEGFNICTNLNGAVYNDIDKWNASQRPISFPFPGKQASVVKGPFENKIWQDFQFSGRLKQQQKRNQQTMSLQGQQSLWEGPYMV